MPTYEYQCLDCNYRVEYFQSIREEPRTVCPVCQGHLTRLVTSGAGLIFKGSGFYITDYKNKSNGNSSSLSHHKVKSEPSISESTVKPEKTKEPVAKTE